MYILKLFQGEDLRLTKSLGENLKSKLVGASTKFIAIGDNIIATGNIAAVYCLDIKIDEQGEFLLPEKTEGTPLSPERFCEIKSEVEAKLPPK